MNKSYSTAYLLLTLMAFFLACNHIIGRYIHNIIPPIGLSFWRWLFAAILLFLFILYKKRSIKYIFQNNIIDFLILGSLIIGATTLILTALNFSSAINISIINTFQPILTIILAGIFLKQKILRIQTTGILISTLGVLLMISKGQLSVFIKLEFNVGDLLALLAMCLFAAYAINTYRIPKQLDVSESLFGIIISGCTVLLPFYLLESFLYKPVPMNTTSLWAIPVLGLLVSLFSMLIWNLGNRIVGPTRATVFINLIPVFGIILAIAVLGETLLLSHIIGMLIIFIGVACVIKPRLLNAS